MINNQNSHIEDLKMNLKVHKDIVHNLLAEGASSAQNQVIESIFNEMLRTKENYEDLNEEKKALEAKCLILEQINDEIKFKERETEYMLSERISELEEAVERKEFLFQLKEQKWAAIENIMVDYAREDVKLQQMLADLRYIWDDVSTKRNVKNVLQENEDLRKIIRDQKETISVLSLRLQENMTVSTSNEIHNMTQNSSAKKGSDESRKLPDLNCFDVKVVNKEIMFMKKSDTQRLSEQIKHLENVIGNQADKMNSMHSDLEAKGNPISIAPNLPHHILFLQT